MIIFKIMSDNSLGDFLEDNDSIAFSGLESNKDPSDLVTNIKPPDRRQTSGFDMNSESADIIGSRHQSDMLSMIESRRGESFSKSQLSGGPQRK